MKVGNVQSTIITPKTTGYASAVSLGLAVYSGVSKNKTIRKTHKPLAWITAGLTILHIGLTEYYHYKYKSSKK